MNVSRPSSLNTSNCHYQPYKPPQTVSTTCSSLLTSIIYVTRMKRDYKLDQRVMHQLTLHHARTAMITLGVSDMQRQTFFITKQYVSFKDFVASKLLIIAIHKGKRKENRERIGMVKFKKLLLNMENVLGFQLKVQLKVQIQN